MTDSNKAAALSFLEMVIAGSIEDAYDKFVSMAGKHHNIYFPAGMEVLKQAMIENHRQAPNKQFSVKHALEDGEMVAVHSHLIPEAGAPGFAVTHLFRFEAGKIAEMWDCIMPLQADSPNSDGAF